MTSVHKKAIALDFSEGPAKPQRAADAAAKPAPGKHDRPWRKSAAAVKAERERSAAILGEGSLGTKHGGVSLEQVRVVMACQELLDAAASSRDGLDAVQGAATKLLQAATNARPEEEVKAARAALDAAAEHAGLTAAIAKCSGNPVSSATSKLQLLHEVMPRLWVGGWAALNDDSNALRQRKVTHVVSVLSADQRKLPPFVQGHLYVRVDDTEEAADTLASHFEEIATFVDAARSAGGVVFIHCGAGISRAPTSACAYLIWKLRIPASDAVKLVRSSRQCARPNVGFVKALKAWEKKVLASESVQSEPPKAPQLAAKAEPPAEPREAAKPTAAAPAAEAAYRAVPVGSAPTTCRDADVALS